MAVDFNRQLIFWFSCSGHNTIKDEGFKTRARLFTLGLFETLGLDSFNQF